MNATTKRWLGIALIAVPIPLMVIVLSLYAVVSFIIASTGAELALVSNIVNVLLSLLGLVSVLGILIGIPAGIVLITLSEVDPEVKRRRAKELKKNPHYKN